MKTEIEISDLRRDRRMRALGELLYEIDAQEEVRSHLVARFRGTHR